MHDDMPPPDREIGRMIQSEICSAPRDALVCQVARRAGFLH
jgi:hypothetical protein